MGSGPSISHEKLHTEFGEANRIVAKTKGTPTLPLVLASVALFGALSAARAEYANPHGVAVIIGNKAYRNERVPEVAYAHRDAEAFRRFVLDVLGFNPDNLIDLRDATQAEMEAAFGNERSHHRKVWRYLHPRHGSDVLVFYSGHGVPGLKDRRGYLLPVDADPDSAEINGYPIDLLYANLGGLDAAKSVRVFLDACFSGTAIGGCWFAPPHRCTCRRRFPRRRKAGSRYSRRRRARRWPHGTTRRSTVSSPNHLLDALYGAGDADGDGRVTAAEAKVYLDDTMTIAARREFGRDQYASLNGVAGEVLARAGDGGAFPARPSLDDSGAVVGAAPDVGKGGAAGGGGEEPPPPVETPEAVEAALGLTHAQRVLMQHGLLSLGHDIGVVDGAFGRRTRSGIEGYQREKGFPETGYLTGELRDALVMLGERRREDEAGREAERQRLAAERERRDREKQAAERRAAERRADDAAFAEAKRLHTPASYRSYLDRGGRHEAAARALLADVSKPKWEVGAKFRDCAECPEMVVMPAGSFEMGSPSHEGGRFDNEGPLHRVTISEPFAVGVHEVTFREWDACHRAGGCSRNPGDNGWGRGNRPVINVSWEDAREYLRWLSGKTGEDYRLLSESEWEYAARAGTTGPFHYGSTISPAQASYNGNHTYGSGRKGRYRGRTVPVGSFSPNAFGLHDAHGNVWEWVEDCWHASYAGAPSDGRVWTSGGDCGTRVLRGGSWSNLPRILRSAYRFTFTSGSRLSFVGFRVSRTLD